MDYRSIIFLTYFEVFCNNCQNLREQQWWTVLLLMAIYHVISNLDRLFYSFSDGFLLDVRDGWNNKYVEVNGGDTNSISGRIFNRYFNDEVT